MTARSIFYGWWVVAAFCVTTFISTGIRHAVGPFLKPIVADLGLDRASFSLVVALSLLLYGVFMPLAGYALDLHRIPNAGHWSAYENAPEVNRLMLEFFSTDS